MTSPMTAPLELSLKDKFNTLFSGFGLLLCIAIVLGVFAFGQEHESQITFIIMIVLNLAIYGWMIKSFIVGLQAWNKLQKLLPNGALAMARCVNSKHYSYDDSQNRTYKLTYQFEVDGKKYSFTFPSVAKVKLPITVLYDQHNPDFWLALVMLPDGLADRVRKSFQFPETDQE